MLEWVDQRLLFTCIRTPKKEDHMLFFVGYQLDDRIGKCLPSLLLMRACLAFGYCECSVQQEDTLFGPTYKAAMAWERCAYVVFYLFEDVDKARWHACVFIDGEA